MPERLNRVTFTVPMGTQTISWDAREVLLAKLAQKQTEAWLRQALAGTWSQEQRSGDPSSLRSRRSFPARGAERRRNSIAVPAAQVLADDARRGLGRHADRAPPRSSPLSRGETQRNGSSSSGWKATATAWAGGGGGNGALPSRRTTTTTTVRSATPASRTGRRSNMTSMRAGSAATKPATNVGSAPAASRSCSERFGWTVDTPP